MFVKQYMKKISGLLILIFVAFSISCEQEQITDVPSRDNVRIKEISFEELLNDTRFNNAFSKVSKNHGKNGSQAYRTVMEEEYNFTIDDYPAKVMYLDSLISYTFSINEDFRTDESFENLVINHYNNGFTKAAIFRYIPDTTNVANSIIVEEHQAKNFIGEVEVTPIIYNSSTVSQRHVVACTTFTGLLCNYQYTHIAGARCEHTYFGSFTTCETFFEIPDYYTTMVQIIADYYHGDGGGGYSNTALNSFINGLTPEGLMIYYDNPDIEEYLLDNIMTIPNPAYNPLLGGINETIEIINPQALLFANEFIQNSIESGLNLDFNLSLKSPANIDVLSIDKDTPEGKKFDCIYTKLTESPTFINLFINTFGGDQTKLNVKFEIADNLPDDTAGNCKLSTYTSNGVIKYNNLIRINKNILNGTVSDIKIARTILHECIHAYLNIKKMDCNLGTTIQELNGLDLQELIGTFYQGFNCHINVNDSAQSQHVFIFDHLIPVFISVLNESKDALIKNQNQFLTNPYAEFENPVTNTSEPFNWNDFFYYMSLEGLHETDAFENNIENDQVKYAKFNHYTSIANFASKECN